MKILRRYLYLFSEADLFFGELPSPWKTGRSLTDELISDADDVEWANGLIANVWFSLLSSLLLLLLLFRVSKLKSNGS